MNCTMASIAYDSVQILRICCRKFSISSIQGDMAREARMMSRLLSNKLDSKIQAAHSAKRAVRLLDKRRKSILNKMYMVNISEVLSYGGFDQILDRGIQITRVSVRDTSTVEVYWLANNDENPLEVQSILSSMSGRVANQLMYANMLGNVPKIVFKRDLSAINVEETQRLLEKISLQMKMEEDVSTVMVDGVRQPLEEPEFPYPVMRKDTFGLPYDIILKRVKDSKKNSYPLRVPAPPSEEDFKKSVASYHESSISVDEQHKKKKELQKFISLYQKSALRSGSRQKNLKCTNKDNIYYEINDADFDGDGEQVSSQMSELEEGHEDFRN